MEAVYTSHFKINKLNEGVRYNSKYFLANKNIESGDTDINDVIEDLHKMLFSFEQWRKINKATEILGYHSEFVPRWQQ
jgi:hypothetical protein